MIKSVKSKDEETNGTISQYNLLSDISFIYDPKNDINIYEQIENYFKYDFGPHSTTNEVTVDFKQKSESDNFTVQLTEKNVNNGVESNCEKVNDKIFQQKLKLEIDELPSCDSKNEEYMYEQESVSKYVVKQQESIANILMSDSCTKTDQSTVDNITNEAVFHSIPTKNVTTQNVTTQNVKKRKRIYLSPCPEMKIHHEQAVTKNQKGPRDPFIRNAKNQAPKMIEKRKYVLEDSSIFDSISQLVSFAYYNSYFQKNCDSDICTCDNPQLCFINFIIKFTKSKKLDFFADLGPYIYLNMAIKKMTILCIYNKLESFLLN